MSEIPLIPHNDAKFAIVAGDATGSDDREAGRTGEGWGESGVGAEGIGDVAVILGDYFVSLFCCYHYASLSIAMMYGIKLQRYHYKCELRISNTKQHFRLINKLLTKPL